MIGALIDLLIAELKPIEISISMRQDGGIWLTTVRVQRDRWGWSGEYSNYALSQLIAPEVIAREIVDRVVADFKASAEQLRAEVDARRAERYNDRP